MPPHTQAPMQRGIGRPGRRTTRTSGRRPLTSLNSSSGSIPRDRPVRTTSTEVASWRCRTTRVSPTHTTTRWRMRTTAVRSAAQRRWPQQPAGSKKRSMLRSQAGGSRPVVVVAKTEARLVVARRCRRRRSSRSPDTTAPWHPGPVRRAEAEAVATTSVAGRRWPATQVVPTRPAPRYRAVAGLGPVAVAAPTDTRRRPSPRRASSRRRPERSLGIRRPRAVP
jgi:hypothetical protein